MRDKCNHQRIGAGADDATEPQCGDLFAGDGWNDFDFQPFPGWRDAQPVAGLRTDYSLPCDGYRNGHPKGDAVPLRLAGKMALDAFWA